MTMEVAGKDMARGRSKNRRRVDPAQRAAAIQGLAERLAPALLRVTLAVLAVAGATGTVGLLYQWALTSTAFELRTIQFSGLHRATEGELTKAAGLAPGVNLFELDSDATAKAMGSHPWVKSVAVRRNFPSRVRVDVVEHQPVALASLGDLYLVDADGEPFKRAQPGEAVDLPLVSGVDRDSYTASPQAVAARLRGAIEAAQAFESAGRAVGGRVSEVRLEALGSTVFLTSGLEVHLGEGAPAEELGRLARVAAELSKRGLVAQVIRLDNRVRPGWVTVKLSQVGLGR